MNAQNVRIVARSVHLWPLKFSMVKFRSSVQGLALLRLHKGLGLPEGIEVGGSAPHLRAHMVQQAILSLDAHAPTQGKRIANVRATGGVGKEGGRAPGVAGVPELAVLGNGVELEPAVTDGDGAMTEVATHKDETAAVGGVICFRF